MILVIIQSLGLNCFDQNMTLYYSKQNAELIFEAFPLAADGSVEYKTCVSLNQKQFTAEFFIGSQVFVALVPMTYFNDQKMTIGAKCKGVSCAVDAETVTSYQFTFTEENVVLISVVPTYMVTYYDAGSCFLGISLLYTYDNAGKSVLKIRNLGDVSQAGSKCRFKPAASPLMRILVDDEVYFYIALPETGPGNADLQKYLLETELVINCETYIQGTLTQDKATQLCNDNLYKLLQLTNYVLEVEYLIPQPLPNAGAGRLVDFSLRQAISEFKAQLSVSCYEKASISFSSSGVTVDWGFPAGGQVNCSTEYIVSLFGGFDEMALVIIAQEGTEFEVIEFPLSLTSYDWTLHTYAFFCSGENCSRHLKNINNFADPTLKLSITCKEKRKLKNQMAYATFRVSSCFGLGTQLFLDPTQICVAMTLIPGCEVVQSVKQTHIRIQSKAKLQNNDPTFAFELGLIQVFPSADNRYCTQVVAEQRIRLRNLLNDLDSYAVFQVGEDYYPIESTEVMIPFQQMNLGLVVIAAVIVICFCFFFYLRK